MAVLQITTPHKTRAVELPDGLVVIGRHHDSDVVLEDKSASRQHCTIQSFGGSYILCDLDSRNGTHIKNKRIDKAIIKFGDAFLIGKTILQIFEDSTPPVELVGETDKSNDNNEETSVSVA
jgi:pSer/pThr/pTyr-binding forkhead associated (FHA) protein